MAKKPGLLARLVLPPQPEPPASDPPRWVNGKGKDRTCRACRGTGRNAPAGQRGDNEECRGCDGTGHYG